MKPLDEFIKMNLDHFNDEEPLQGHFERFDKRLENPVFRNSDPYRIWMITKIAAAVLLAFVISYSIFHRTGYIRGNLDRWIVSNNYPELREAEAFYTYQFDNYYSQIKKLGFNDDQNQKKQVLRELSEMDRQVQIMKQDLIQNPDDERVMHAIINSYQVKLEIMDMIIARTQISSTIL
jgi:hypothetical protein